MTPGQVLEEAEATWIPLCLQSRGVGPPPAYLCHGLPLGTGANRCPMASSPAETGAGTHGCWDLTWDGRVGVEFSGAVADDNPCCPPCPGTHYIRGVNNTRQPWHSSEGRKQYSLKPANPTEEGLASLHSVLFRKQPFLWRAALLYYTIERASRLSFSALFRDLEQYVQDAGVRWEYCVRAKRGQTDTSRPGTTRGVGIEFCEEFYLLIEYISLFFYYFFFLRKDRVWYVLLLCRLSITSPVGCDLAQAPGTGTNSWLEHEE